MFIVLRQEPRSDLAAVVISAFGSSRGSNPSAIATNEHWRNITAGRSCGRDLGPSRCRQSVKVSRYASQFGVFPVQVTLTPIDDSMNSMYFCACDGRSDHARTPLVELCQPGKSTYSTVQLSSCICESNGSAQKVKECHSQHQHLQGTW